MVPRVRADCQGRRRSGAATPGAPPRGVRERGARGAVEVRARLRGDGLHLEPARRSELIEQRVRAEGHPADRAVRDDHERPPTGHEHPPHRSEERAELASPARPRRLGVERRVVAPRPELELRELFLAQAQPAQAHVVVIEVVVGGRVGRRGDDAVDRRLADRAERARVVRVHVELRSRSRQEHLVLREPRHELLGLAHEEPRHRPRREATLGQQVVARVAALLRGLGEDRGEDELEVFASLSRAHVIEPVAQGVELEQHVRREQAHVVRPVAVGDLRAALPPLRDVRLDAGGEPQELLALRLRHPAQLELGEPQGERVDVGAPGADAVEPRLHEHRAAAAERVEDHRVPTGERLEQAARDRGVQPRRIRMEAVHVRARGVRVGLSDAERPGELGGDRGGAPLCTLAADVGERASRIDAAGLQGLPCFSALARRRRSSNSASSADCASSVAAGRWSSAMR